MICGCGDSGVRASVAENEQVGVELALDAMGLDSEGSRVYLSVSKVTSDIGPGSSSGNYYIEPGKLLPLSPGKYSIKPIGSPIAKDGTVYRYGNDSTRGDSIITATVYADGKTDSDGVIVYEPTRGCDLSQEEIENAVELVRNDPARKQEADRLEDAAKKRMESSIEEQESWAKEFDFEALSASYAALAKEATLIDYGDDAVSEEEAQTSWSYALVDMSGDDVPELLLCKTVEAEEADYITQTTNYIRIARYDSQKQEARLIGPDNTGGMTDDEWENCRIVLREKATLEEDVYDSDGLTTTKIAVGTSGHCLLMVDALITNERYTVKDGNLVTEDSRKFINHYGCGSHDVSDLSLLEELGRGAWRPHVMAKGQ